jgi:O-antigen ligase
MALIFTVLYLMLTYLSPTEVFPALAPFRIELIIGAAALATGLASLSPVRSISRLPQTYLLMGFIAAIGISRLLTSFHPGAAYSAVRDFLPPAMMFYIVLFSSNTVRAVRIAANALVAVMIYFVLHGAFAYFTDPTHSALVLSQTTFNIFGYPESTARLCAVGFLADPNDFAQVLLVAIGLLTPNWGLGGLPRLFGFVIPVSILVFGVALTKSRGAFLGLLGLTLLASSAKFGRVKSLVVTAAVGMVLLALNFTGNRVISPSNGLDRLDLWRDGWGMFKSSPLWGVGFGEFSRRGMMTAHNSFVLCFTELGVLGTFFWVGMIVPSLRQMTVLRRMKPESEAQAAAVSMANGVRMALWGFLLTSWFLSRTYTGTFYLLIAMAASLTSIVEGEKHGVVLNHNAHWFSRVVMVECATLIGIYITLKFRQLAF